MWYLGCAMPSHIYTCNNAFLFTWTQILLGTHFPHRMFIFVFQSVATVSGCLVQTMPSLTLERTSFNSPRPTTKHKWDISASFHLLHPKTNAIQILDNWSFYDRLPCHGVTRFPGVLKPRHSETGGGGWEGGLLLQLLVPHLLPAAFWHWHGWCEKQVFSMLPSTKWEHLPLIYNSCCAHTPRLMYSMLPVPGKSFLQHHIRPRCL